MTDETVDCHNCGRPNPEWAQVCRSCGVALRHGDARAVPAGPFPTDRDSLISMGAVVATILAAVFVGLFVSGLNPTESGVGQATPTPSATVQATPTPEPEATPTPQPEATPTPTPGLPGTLAFGEAIDGDGRVTEPVEQFTPSMTFAYSVTVPDGFGEPQIQNEVARIEGEEETIVLEREAVTVDPSSSTFGYVIGPASNFVSAWGPGEYEWRVYVGDEVVARQRFRLAEG